MTNTLRYITLLVGLATILGAVFAVLKAMWNIRGAWDQTNYMLAALIERNKEDHQRLEERDNSLDRRIERHEEWHRQQQDYRIGRW